MKPIPGFVSTSSVSTGRTILTSWAVATSAPEESSATNSQSILRMGFLSTQLPGCGKGHAAEDRLVARVGDELGVDPPRHGRVDHVRRPVLQRFLVPAQGLVDLAERAVDSRERHRVDVLLLRQGVELVELLPRARSLPQIP